jgi:hypothetical protein
MINTNTGSGPEHEFIAGASGGLNFAAVPSAQETISENDRWKAEFTNLAEDFFNSRYVPISSGHMADGRMDSIHIVQPMKAYRAGDLPELRPFLLNRITSPRGDVRYLLNYDGDKDPRASRDPRKRNFNHVVHWGNDTPVLLDDKRYDGDEAIHQRFEKANSKDSYIEPLRKGMYYDPKKMRVAHSPASGDRLVRAGTARLRTKLAVGYAAMAPHRDEY